MTGPENIARPIVNVRKKKSLFFMEHLVVGANIPLPFGPVNAKPHKEFPLDPGK
jgi:hypothetical protein